MSELWDAEAARFDDEPDHGLREPATRVAWQRLLTAHLPAPPARIADLGCGTGTLTVLLADAGYTVDGVDFSPAMVEQARHKAGDRPGVTLIVADAGSPPLRPRGYDVVLCRHVLWTLPDPAAALDAWTGLLDDGGRLLLIEGTWHTGSGLSAQETETLLRAAGHRPTTYPLDDAVYWGAPISDERYLTVGSRSASVGP